jgi:hypothetical protein
MSEVLDLEPQMKFDTAGKRALIENELRENPQRSDREIARVVGHGVDHKTVGAARERLGIATPLGNSPEAPTPTERRHMLIDGAEDFNKLYPPGPSEPTTAEEQVDEAIAKGVVNLAPADDEKDLCWCIPHQARIECSMTTTEGELEIWQEGQHGPEEDSRIHVARGSAVRLARNILYAAGFKSIGIYAYVKGGGCVDLEDGDTPDCVRTAAPGYGPVR